MEGQTLILGVISQGFHCICIFWEGGMHFWGGRDAFLGGRGKYTFFYSNIEALFT